MQQPPDKVIDFRTRYQDVWDSFVKLAASCHESGGPLDERSRRLAKLGIAIGMRHEGAVHSAVRHAIQGGLSSEELFHVAILSITTLGWPAAYAAITWINDEVSGSSAGYVTEPE